MLKSAAGRFANVVTKSVLPAARVNAAVIARFVHREETAEEFDARYINYLNRPDIDGWEIRKAMTDICGEDVVPDPKIICCAMYACRRVNDYALAIRILEAVKNKCGHKVKTIYPYIIQEIKPVLCELGIDTPEELGYDKPELALQDIFAL